MIKLLIVLFIVYEVVISENGSAIISEISDYDDVQHGNRLMVLPSRISLAKKRFEALYADQQIYMGFANDPFGPSKLQDKNSKFNLSTAFIKGKHGTKISNGRNEIPQVKRNVTEEGRPKRGLLHLYNMVSCGTGCNPLIYKGYGCYCGFLGSGYAVDGIDRCCKMHDWCYSTTRCQIFLEYFMPYYWMCYKKRPICAIIHGEYGGRKSCAAELCECDRKLSECLRRYPCPNSRALCKSSPLRLLQNALLI